MPELVYNVKFRIDTNIQEGAAGVTAYKEKVEELAEELESANAQIERMRKGGGKTGQIEDPFKNLNQGAVNAGKSFSVANQAVFSFSDGIQDATQFSQGFSQGMRAIGNNIGFTAELMANLGRRVNDYNKENGTAITTTDAFREAIFKVDKEGNILRNSFGLMQLSATGFVLALNAGITILSILTTAFTRAEKETENAGKQLDEYIKSLSRLRGLATGDLGIVDSLRQQETLLERVRPRLEQNAELEQRIALIRSEPLQSPSVRRANEEFIEQIERRIEANNNVIKLLGLEVEGLEDLEIQINATKDAMGLLTSGSGDLATNLGVVVDRFSSDARLFIKEFELGLYDLSGSVVQQISDIDELIRIYTELANSTDGETRRAYVQAASNLLGIRKELEATLPQLDQQVELSIDLDTRRFVSEFSFVRDAITGELTRIEVPAEFIEMPFISDIGFDLADGLNESFNKRSEVYQEESLTRRLSSMKMFNEQMILITKERLDAELELERQKEQARINVFNSAQSAIASLSQVFANKNKGIAIALLAIEKGLKVAQVVTSATRSIAEVQSSAASAYARAAASAAGFGPLASVAAGAAAAGPILAQIPLIKATAGASVAAILAAGIGQGAQIVGGGGGGASGGSLSGMTRQQAPQFGFQSEEVKRSPQFLPRSESSMASRKVDVQILANRKQLYAMVKDGQEEYRQIST